MDALKKHLTKIAKDRQEKLRKKLGKEAYSAAMRAISLQKKKKKVIWNPTNVKIETKGRGRPIKTKRK